MCKASGTVYGLGFIGALVYNLQYADGFRQILFGIGKSLVWPAMIVYRLFSMWQM